MDGTQVIWMLALALVLSAAWTDWRTRKIPNWLTVPALLLGVTVHTLIAGWPGAKTSLEGAGWLWLCCFLWCCCAGWAQGIGN